MRKETGPAARAKRVAHEGHWETGDLGTSDKHVRRSSKGAERDVDDAMGLQMISLRLQKDLLDKLKWIASHHRVNYQPMIRDVLARWARSEFLSIADQMRHESLAREAIAAAKRAARKRA